MEEPIDWNKFEQRNVGFEPEIEKTLELFGWQMGTWFGRPGITFSVTQEDGQMVNKKLTTTSRRLISALRPILEKADSEGRKSIKLSIIRRGEGFDTNYEVAETLLAGEEVVSDE